VGPRRTGAVLRFGRGLIAPRCPRPDGPVAVPSGLDNRVVRPSLGSIVLVFHADFPCTSHDNSASLSRFVVVWVVFAVDLGVMLQHHADRAAWWARSYIFEIAVLVFAWAAGGRWRHYIWQSSSSRCSASWQAAKLAKLAKPVRILRSRAAGHHGDGGCGSSAGVSGGPCGWRGVATGVH